MGPRTDDRRSPAHMSQTATILTLRNARAESRRHVYSAYITTPEELATTATNLALAALAGRGQ